MIEKGLEGCNGTLFAYGQTASGKTHTLMGTRDEPGIIPRSVFGVFVYIAEAVHSNVLVRVSYIEVYNEELKDLFAPEERGLKIVEDPKTGPWVRNAMQAVASSAEHAMALIEYGESNRAYGSTNMNERSSRSHVLFRVTIKRGFTTASSAHSQTNPLSSEGSAADGSVIVDETGPEWESAPSAAVRASALNYVDLAGSERLKKTGATGQALKEANAINTSLMTLGTVIAKLSSGDKSGHIPYRDSKLTHLLSSSLGGNSLTTMVACISPSASDREESVNSLRYAGRASKIVNETAANEMDNVESVMGNYSSEIAELRQLLEAFKAEGVSKDAELDRLRSFARDVDEATQGRGIAGIRDLERKLADGSDASKHEKQDLLLELDALQRQVLEEQQAREAAESRGLDARQLMELEQQKALWEEEIGVVEDVAEQQRAELEQQLEDERTSNARRIVQLVEQVAAASVGDMSVVHATLREEIKRQKIEIERLTALQASSDRSGSGGGGGQTATASALTKMLVVAEKQLKDAQFQVSKLRGELKSAQEEALVSGRAMAEELQMLRKELRGFAASHVEHSNFDVPEGYVLWFHAHTLPRIFALAAPENAHVLLRPHAAAPVAARNLPLGVKVEVDGTSVAVALQANPALREQHARLVPGAVSDKAFWLHYFSHVHAIKAHVASQARARATQMGGVSDPQLRDTFLAVLQEGILLRRHYEEGVSVLVKLWMSAQGTLSILADGESEPELIALGDVVKVSLGAASFSYTGGGGRATFAKGVIDELAFSLDMRGLAAPVLFEASARLERQALVEGFRLLLLG